MRSAPTLKILITPFASVAILEKLALLKIALCRAPALSSASSGALLVFGPREPRLRSLGSRRIRLVTGSSLGVRGALAPDTGSATSSGETLPTIWPSEPTPSSPRGADDVADGAARFLPGAISSAPHLRVL